MILTIHGRLLIIAIIQSKLQSLVIDIDFFIGCSTVKIERVKDQYLFYYNLREIEKLKLHILILYIKCVSIFW